MKRHVSISVLAPILLGLAVAVSGLAVAQIAPPQRDDRTTATGRSVPHYVDNADYDPQPYYVDGVQYKPYDKNGKKKSDAAKADTVRGRPAAALVAQEDETPAPDLHPYVPTRAQVASSASASAANSAQASPSPAVNTPARPGASAGGTVTHQAAAPADNPYVPKKRQRYADAIIEAVDKITAENVRFDAPLGKSIRYKGLIYVVKACETTAEDEQTPDVIAYMQVRTSPTDGPNPAPSKEIFHGWTFASSPGLNPLQHPVYDAWVVSCRNPLPGAPG